ncbi:unnamed protein product [Rhizoctonia solani]|uniref:Uncharacterized protein n=1 Tax=Rhizoctonia solani TaxID=456999 RepID=A0A8H3BHH6_9AGAM|nr:unnamed protein product [Rhizoctonia solani]
MSSGVFLWATLAVKYIKKSSFPALPRLRKVLSNQKSPVTDHFDTLYASVLETAIDNDENEIKVAYLRCIGAILVISTREPLAMPDLQHLLLAASQVDQRTLEQVEINLGPLLLVPDGRCIRFHHPSFQNFVTDLSRSGQFHIHLDQYEAEPAAFCLHVMHRDLCFNICQLETSHRLNRDIADLNHRIDSHIGPMLKYACTHWIDHFIASPTQALVESIKRFMEGPQLMYWIEVLSLLGCIDIALAGLSKLSALDLGQFSDSSLVISWAKDAHRFILSFYDAITTSTPHLYVSALAFAPRNCTTALRIRPHFPNIITVARGGDSYWHPCIKSIVHPHAIQTLSISPDGKAIAVGYPDGSLAIWDMQTGTCLQKSLVGHRDMVICVVYSPDGNLVASSSHDATIRVWNVSQGLQESCVLSGHSGPIHSVAFSPNSSLIASASSDRTIRLWRPDATHSIHEPYVGHSSRITSVVFSPNGTQLVSGSWDKTVRIWSVDLGSLRLAESPLVITGHTEPVTCVAFSPDGTMIASGSLDKTLQLWDAQTGTKSESPASPAKHSDTITSIAFSPNGKYIASCSLDGAIHVWSTAASTYSQPFGHSSPVNAVAFSPDGLHIVSGSTDMTTRIWETTILETARIWDIDACPKSMAVGPLAGHSSAVNSVAVTRNGTRIISASNDYTVRIWDAQTGILIRDPLTGNSSFVNCVAVSPDGTRIVSSSINGLIELWDTATHHRISSYRHSKIIYTVTFSPSSALIAFGTLAADRMVYLWDVTGWKMIKEGLQGHSNTVFSVAFSPEETCVASGSADGTVILWDIKTHSRLGAPLSGHRSYVRSVTFSACGTWLASGGVDGTVRLWDRHTCNTIFTLSGHDSCVMSVAFSPDGSYIASGSTDNTVRLWNVQTGQHIGQPFTEHTNDVNSIAFSPDGHYLISGSSDNTIRVRNIPTLYPAVDPETELPDAFRWPSSPYEMLSHPEHPGWVTQGHDSLVLWLPPHYEQREKFLGPSERAPYPPVYLNYSKFVHGTAWTKIAGNPTSGDS